MTLKKTRISPRFSTDFPVFDTVAKKPSSFLDILHKTNRKHHVYNSAASISFTKDATLHTSSPAEVLNEISLHGTSVESWKFFL